MTEIPPECGLVVTATINWPANGSINPPGVRDLGRVFIRMASSARSRSANHMMAAGAKGSHNAATGKTLRWVGLQCSKPPCERCERGAGSIASGVRGGYQRRRGLALSGQFTPATISPQSVPTPGRFSRSGDRGELRSLSGQSQSAEPVCGLMVPELWVLIVLLSSSQAMLPSKVILKELRRHLPA